MNFIKIKKKDRLFVINGLVPGVKLKKGESSQIEIRYMPFIYKYSLVIFVLILLWAIGGIIYYRLLKKETNENWINDFSLFGKK